MTHSSSLRTPLRPDGTQRDGLDSGRSFEKAGAELLLLMMMMRQRHSHVYYSLENTPGCTNTLLLEFNKDVADVT